MTSRVILRSETTAAVLLVLLSLGIARPAEAQVVDYSTGPDYVAPVDVDTAGLDGPVQPVFYRHDIHAGQYQMDCRYCHYAVEVSANPALPAMETCMGCHLIAGAGNPEVQKVREAWNQKQPIEWVKVHNLPEYVRFPHMRHVKAEVSCQTCHGSIETMPQVYQYAPLKMGWCLDCHKQSDVTTDCTACHY